jgi:hypothetical protein
LHELDHEEAFDAEFEITDLDPHKQGSRTVNRGVHGQRLSLRTRLWMALSTILGIALFSLLLVSTLPSTGASQPGKASPGQGFTPAAQAPPRHVQMLIVQKVIYLLDQDGVVSALWTRHKYVYLLWQHHVAPSSKLLRVDHDVVYLASPDGSQVGLRASDGAFLWRKRGSEKVTLLSLWRALALR